MSACLPHQATILIRPDRIVSLSHVMEVTTASWDHSLQHQLVQLIHQQTSLMILLMDATLEVSAKLATTVLRELQLRSSAPQASNAQLLGCQHQMQIALKATTVQEEPSLRPLTAQLATTAPLDLPCLLHAQQEDTQVVQTKSILTTAISVQMATTALTLNRQA